MLRKFLNWLRNAELIAAITHLADAVQRLGNILRLPQIRPDPFRLKTTGERMTEQRDLIQFVIEGIQWPEGLNDIVSGELTVETSEGSSTVAVAKGQTEVDNGYEGAQDSEVVASLVFIDDALLHSEPRVQTFTLIDDQPPAKPGEFSVRTTGERTVGVDGPTGSTGPEAPTGPTGSEGL